MLVARLLETIKKEDAFDLFKSEIEENQISKTNNIEELKTNLIDYFKKKVDQEDSENSLLSNEAMNMINLIGNFLETNTNDEDDFNFKKNSEVNNITVNEPDHQKKKRKIQECMDNGNNPEKMVEDELVEFYVKSLTKFVEGIDDNDLKEYVEYVTKE